MRIIDFGPEPHFANVMMEARENKYFRRAFWTGNKMQLTLMSIPPYDDIGAEMHPDVDQMIRVEGGMAIVRMGTYIDNLKEKCVLKVGDAVFVPAGTWHNVINTGVRPLKLSSIYAPVQHPRGTIHEIKEDAAHCSED